MDDEYDIPKRILDKVDNTINRYNLLDRDKPILVAFSGGKDSSVTALALRKLGYNVKLAVVGGIWKNYDLDGVASIARNLEFEPKVIDLSDPLYKSRLSRSRKENLEESLDELSDIGQELERTKIMGNISPCTKCYNNKVMALETAAEQFSTDRVVFGHHQDDSLASFIKLALMYDDYSKEGNRFYKTELFLELVRSTIEDLKTSEKSEEIMERWNRYIVEDKAGTDEPPAQEVTGGSNVKIVRPLYGVSESEIVDIIRKNNIKVEGSGCAHGLELTRTPREIVHQDLLPRLEESQRRELVKIIDSSLMEDGSAKSNVRKNRDRLLPGYKLGGCKL